MAKAKAAVKKAKPAPKKTAPAKIGLLKAASKKMAGAAARVVQVAAKMTKPDKPVKGPVAQKLAAKVASRIADLKEKAVAIAPKGKAAVAPPPAAVAKGKVAKDNGKDSAKELVSGGPKSLPRATKLPAPGQPLTKREMEQLLTAGAGRGVEGEGSLKGRLIVKEEFPYLQVVGRDKRELLFLLQGPDQEVLPAYMDHKVSVSGLLRKTTNYGGTVDVRKYSAKKPDEISVVEAPVAEKLKYLSPGEVEQICASGMGAGMKGFATLRGNLEMTGDEFFLVLSNGGTRAQVSFLLEGKGIKGLRKHVGHVLQVNGITEKNSGWGGRVQIENFEPKTSEHKAVSRDAMEIVHVDGGGTGSTPMAVEAKLNQGLTVRLQEKPGFTWAIEPMVAKRVGLREANFEPASGQEAATREFFFTPRTPGQFEIEFFLAKAFAPAQIARTYKMSVSVKP